jgi:hypothetical protein
MMAGDRVSAELGAAVKANAQNATADAVIIWRIVFIQRVFGLRYQYLGVDQKCLADCQNGANDPEADSTDIESWL